MTDRVLWLTMFVAGCGMGRDPEPLSLPSIEQKERAFRNEMKQFNADRFSLECGVLDSISHASHPNQRQESSGCVYHAILEQGQDVLPDAWVAWDWEVSNLDGRPLTSGRDNFELGKGGLPPVFHQVAKEIGIGDSVRIWSPSSLAFGVKGIPGSVPPYAPVIIHARQVRAWQDPRWQSQVLEGSGEEWPWLENWVEDRRVDAIRHQEGGFIQVVDTQPNQPLQPGESVVLNIRTSPMLPTSGNDRKERETAMPWVVGTPDQVVPILELLVRQHPNVETARLWSTSSMAFGEDGVPNAGIPANTPIQFDVEIVRQ